MKLTDSLVIINTRGLILTEQIIMRGTTYPALFLDPFSVTVGEPFSPINNSFNDVLWEKRTSDNSIFE